MSFKLFIALGLSTVALSAYATPLTVVNNTQSDSTSRIHNFLYKCSSEILGKDGITPAGQTQVVSESNIQLACYFTPDHCIADIYASNNCSGEIIATMEFSITEGVQSVVSRSAKYLINASGFRVELNQVA